MDFLFSFTDAATLGRALEQRGYTLDLELEILLDIITDDDPATSNPRTKLAAIAMLSERRKTALEQSGALSQRHARTTINGITIEETRTQRVLSSVQNQLPLLKGPVDAQAEEVIDADVEPAPCIPGEHQPPASGPVPGTTGATTSVGGPHQPDISGPVA